MTSLKDKLLQIVEDPAIVALATRNLSETKLFTQLQVYLCKKLPLTRLSVQTAPNAEEIRRRVKARFDSRCSSQDQKEQYYEQETIGSHQELTYDISEGTPRILASTLRDLYLVGFNADYRGIERGDCSDEESSQAFSAEEIRKGGLNREIQKIESEKPEFDPEALVRESVLAGIEERIRLGLITNPLMQSWFVREEFGTGAEVLHWKMQRPSYLGKTPTWELLTRFDHEAPHYIANATQLVEQVFRDKPTPERRHNLRGSPPGVGYMKITSEDQDKLYQTPFDQNYFNSRMFWIKQGPVNRLVTFLLCRE